MNILSTLFRRAPPRLHAVRPPERPEDKDRITSALRRIQIIKDCPGAVDVIMADGEFGQIAGGQTFIQKGQLDEYVYFLIAGRVRIALDGVKLDEWEAPEVVGELAAATHKPRSADVTALEDGIAFMKLSGAAFRSLLEHHPGVRRQLEERKDAMLQARIRQSAGRRRVTLWKRLPLSAVAGIGTAVLIWFISKFYFGVSAETNYYSSFISGVIAAILVMIFSPVWILRSVAISSAVAATGIYTVGVPHAQLETDGTLIPGLRGKISIGQTFSGSEAVWAMIVLGLIAIVFLIAAWKAQRD